MNNRFITLKALLLLGICTLLMTFSCLASAGHHKNASHDVYVPSDDPMKQVQETLNAAMSSNKLALIILGAQWCHDSRGLAEKFADPQMQSILTKQYETVFIDVGYFEDRRDITQRFGQAHYFATPTVMVVEPHSETLLNGETIQRWGMADSVPLKAYLTYFSEFSVGEEKQVNKIDKVYLDQIKKFEIQQSQRLMSAYQVLSPALKADHQRVEGAEMDELFIRRWREVRAFRLKLQGDIKYLYRQASYKTDSPLTLPTYEQFSWEQQ